MKSEDIVLLGGLAVGAYFLTSQTASVAPLPYPGMPSPGGGTQPRPATGTCPAGTTYNATTRSCIDPTTGLVTSVLETPIGEDQATIATKLLNAAGGALATIGTAAVNAGAVVGHALAALATNPITWAVAGAVGIGYLWWRSQAHHQADEWVQGFQNPFDKTMAEINDLQFTQGTITNLEAECARKAAVADYADAMKSFAAQGDNQALVIRQATETFIQWYGQTPDDFLARLYQEFRDNGYICA